MLYHVRLKNEPQGPWPLRDIVMMSGVTPETLVCPEFDLGAWRPLDSIIGTRSDTAFLFQIRMRAEQLLRTNQKLRWELQQSVQEHQKAVASEKERATEFALELEQRKRQLDEVLEHNLELDTEVDQNQDKLESDEKRIEEARKDFERIDAERKALKHHAEVLERELEEIRRLSSNAEATRTQLDTLKADLESAQRELVRGRAVKEARDRQFEEMRTALDTAQQKSAETEARFRSQSFESETLVEQKSKELELFKLKAERAEASLEEKRNSAEEARMRMEAVEARAAEAESRLRTAESSSTVQGESLKNEREALTNELEKSKLLSGERSKTIEDLRNQLETLRDRATEAENRLRIAQTKFSGNEANLREEKEGFSRQIEAEKGRRTQAEAALAKLENEIKIVQAKEEDTENRQQNAIDELNIEIRALKQDLVRKSHTVEQLETKLQESVSEIQTLVPAGPPPEEDMDKTQPISPIAPEPEPEAKHEEEPDLPPPPAPEPEPLPELQTTPEPEPLTTAQENISPLSPDAPTVEVGPDANPDLAQESTKRKIPWKLIAAGTLTLLLGGGSYWFFFLQSPETETPEKSSDSDAVMELSPEGQKRFEETLKTVPQTTAPKAIPDRLPTVLRPEPKKARKKRKKLKRVRKKRSKPKPVLMRDESDTLPGYAGN